MLFSISSPWSSSQKNLMNSRESVVQCSTRGDSQRPIRSSKTTQKWQWWGSNPTANRCGFPMKSQPGSMSVFLKSYDDAHRYRKRTDVLDRGQCSIRTCLLLVHLCSPYTRPGLSQMCAEAQRWKPSSHLTEEFYGFSNGRKTSDHTKPLHNSCSWFSFLSHWK